MIVWLFGWLVARVAGYVGELKVDGE